MRAREQAAFEARIVSIQPFQHLLSMNCFQSARFDEPLSRHLAHLIHAGHALDRTIIRHGYQLTRCELELFPLVRRDPLSHELEDHYAECDLSAVAPHERTIRRLPFNRASALVLSLLCGEPAPVPT